MRGLISLLIVAVIAFFVYQFHLTPRGKSESAGSMVQAISTTGVKNDLNAIAQAERAYQAEHGNYATLDELTSSGALAATSRTRQGYTYTVEVTANGFLVTARYTGPASASGQSFSVDQTMEIRAAE